MRIITFNVNGIRSMVKKNKTGGALLQDETIGLCQLVEEEKIDILCLQEIKTQSVEDLSFLRELLPYGDINCCSRKKGYSGVAILSRVQPEWISYGFDLFHEDRIGLYQGWDIEQEGRILCAKFDTFLLVTVYVPNAQHALARIHDRVRWDTLLRNYINELRVEFQQPVILCGDMNIAPEDRDIHRKQPKQTPGVSVEERAGFQGYLEDGWMDAYRRLYPERIGPESYTYWSNFSRAREQGKGWRIDLFLVSPDLLPFLQQVRVLSDYHGSDHGPVLLEVDNGIQI